MVSQSDASGVNGMTLLPSSTDETRKG